MREVCALGGQVAGALGANNGAGLAGKSRTLHETTAHGGYRVSFARFLEAPSQ
jgi:hypothetical protein